MCVCTYVFLPIESVNVKSRYNDVGTDEKTHFLNNVERVCVGVCVWVWVCDCVCKLYECACFLSVRACVCVYGCLCVCVCVSLCVCVFVRNFSVLRICIQSNSRQRVVCLQIRLTHFDVSLF